MFVWLNRSAPERATSLLCQEFFPQSCPKRWDQRLPGCRKWTDAALLPDRKCAVPSFKLFVHLWTLGRTLDLAASNLHIAHFNVIKCFIRIVQLLVVFTSLCFATLELDPLVCCSPSIDFTWFSTGVLACSIFTRGRSNTDVCLGLERHWFYCVSESSAVACDLYFYGLNLIDVATCTRWWQLDSH